jgi:hypothetical protein
VTDFKRSRLNGLQLVKHIHATNGRLPIIFRFAVLYWSRSHSTHMSFRNSAADLRVEGLNVFKKSHETEIHVEILMAMKQGEPRIIRDKIDINSAEAFH